MHSISTGKNKPKVLIVEDDFFIQKIHSKMLALLGCQVELAENGEIALTKNFKDYDLILMDIRMPIMDGITVTQTIRQLELNNITIKNSIPIIGLSGDGDSIEKECLDAGMNAFVMKPVSLEKLKSLLQQYIVHN